MENDPDEIHYQLLKHLPRDSLMVLLDIFNDIWASGEISECWKEATVDLFVVLLHVQQPGLYCNG